MADGPREGFRLWPRRKERVTPRAPSSPPSTQALSEKLTELVHFERGIATLYYFLPDGTLAKLAQTLCQAFPSQNLPEQGIERDVRAKDTTLESWSAVSAVWSRAAWQPGEILPTFGFRIIEALRAQPEVWNVIVDPRAKFFGLAAANDEDHRYWFVLVTGERERGQAGEGATAAR